MRSRLASLVVFGALLSAGPAWAGDTAACVSAAEEGQAARRAGKLRAALEHFNTCARETCPRVVRGDCVRWQGELVSALPTVVFGARDPEGRDLFDVTVSVEGETIATTLDGRAVPVDPGPHTFRFEANGLKPVFEKVLVKEGEKSRVVNVAFGGQAPRSAPHAEPAKGAPPVTAPETPAAAPARGHTVYPWILTGVGGAAVVTGLVVLLTTPSRPPNCSADTRTCTRLPGETDEQFSDDQSRAGNADAQPWVGVGVMAAGAAAIAGGLIWHFLETSASSSATRLQIFLSPAPGRATAGAELRF